ncbi:MAG: bifunctional 4-hydroxy-2-oxoglutarate aldolase/2-dehydro-3-deoxy-phosphogluconate aldolase [Caulobacteraceae bacterium]|nr:bifunctional 4-hydroxy-2-oxoglutarate aldolase/2-dehydro-3-deoxy-phosphogluconate aldolase [Caulobacteraceae bacterium]
MPHDRLSVLTALIDQGVVPVFNHPDIEVCEQVVRACAAAGARAFEFTNRGDFAADVFLQLSRRLAGKDVILGAGSVVDAPTAGLYIAAGARFVVGPGLNADVAKVCNRRKVAYLPGCASPTEIGMAEELGCEIVKLFPGEAAGGPAFVKAVLGPMPWTKIMPTGGVEPTEASLKAWFDAGVAAVGMGGGLVPGKLVEARDWAGLTAHVAEAMALARRVRGR